MQRLNRYLAPRCTPVLGAVLSVAALGLSACGGGGDSAVDAAPIADAPPVVDAAPEIDEWEQLLLDREYNYNAALRTASLRLVGDLPTLAQIKFVDSAATLDEQRLAYESLIRSMLDDPRFTTQIFKFWQDTFRLGDDPLLDTGPAFAAQLTVEERPFTELFTASQDNCPSFDPATGTFTPATCDTGVPAEAGILTNRGFLKSFYSNMAFRRTRWVQETFDCSAFPAEIRDTPIDVGGPALYTGEWDYETLAGAETGGNVDFRDKENINCGNCHTTINHIAPLLGKFDDNGMYVADGYGVTLPTGGLAVFTDWLVEGEGTGWRAGIYTADLPEMGAAMAADPAMAECLVMRVWNWGMGRGDAVDTLSVVPTDILAPYVADFQQGYNMKELVYAVFTSEDFVKY